MAENVELQDQAPSLESKPQRKSALRFLGAFCSLLVPGLGQLILGNKRRGIVFLVTFFALMFLYWPIRLPAFYAGFLALVVLLVSLACASSWQALRSSSPRPKTVSRWWLLLVIPLALIVSLSIEMKLALRSAGFGIFSVPSSSMASTIDSGDTIVADTRYFQHHEPHDGEVVIFRQRGILHIKRIIASGGEQIHSQDGVVSVNGQTIAEPYVQHTGDAMPEMNTFGPIKVPDHELFMMGDNRDASLDSRLPDQFGAVSKSDLVGVPLYVLSTKRTGRKVE